VQAGRFNDALLAFSVAMGLDRENSDARAGMILCLDRLGRYRDAHALARMGIALGGDESAGFRRLLFLTDSLSAVAKPSK
jgi:thioredoxin-like negative regulator of GroEL